MEAALAGAGIAVMDRAYAAPHLGTGRLRALGATIPLAEGYHLAVTDAPGPRSDAIRSLTAWLAGQAGADDGRNQAATAGAEITRSARKTTIAAASGVTVGGYP